MRTYLSHQFSRNYNSLQFEGANVEGVQLHKATTACNLHHICYPHLQYLLFHTVVTNSSRVKRTLQFRSQSTTPPFLVKNCWTPLFMPHSRILWSQTEFWCGQCALQKPQIGAAGSHLKWELNCVNIFLEGIKGRTTKFLTCSKSSHLCFASILNGLDVTSGRKIHVFLHQPFVSHKCRNGKDSFINLFSMPTIAR
jgi:hypothetical protein